MIVHVVRAGECLAAIAKHYHFPRWQTLYEAPENEAFRKKRPNPNVIYEGDEITIPDKRPKHESAATAKKHRHKIKRSAWMFRVEMRDQLHKGLEGVPYELRIDGLDPIKKKTGKNGLIETRIPAEANAGTLFFQGETIRLNFGGLDPVTRLSGVQQRLNNLGFKADPGKSSAGPQTRKAVAAFQASQKGLKTTGKLDDDTLKRLLEVHDNDKKACEAEEPMSFLEEPPASEELSCAGPGGEDFQSLWKYYSEEANDRPNRLFFAIYYYVDDRAFERAALTWQREVEARASYDPSKDQFISIEIKTETDFKDAWAKIQKKSEAGSAEVVEGHVYSHASIYTPFKSEYKKEKSWGFEFQKSGTDDGTLTKAEVENLPKLVWSANGLLVLHGCNSGRDHSGWIPAEVLAHSQGVRSRGQMGYATFSKDPAKQIDIEAATTDVYLWAYYTSYNARWSFFKTIVSDGAMPPYDSGPVPTPINP